MGPLLAIARVVPAWLWVVIAVLAWGGWNHYKATRAAGQAQRA